MRAMECGFNCLNCDLFDGCDGFDWVRVVPEIKAAVWFIYRYCPAVLLYPDILSGLFHLYYCV